MRHILLAGAAMFAALSVTPLDAATTYTYDSLGRLSVVDYDNGYQIVYTYDSAGNRTSVVTQSGSGLPPVANNDYIVVNQNGTDTFNPLTIDTDPQNYTMTIIGVGTPSHGTATYTSTSVTYTPTASPSFAGKDSFSYTISDGHGSTAQATVFATVGGLGPTANPDSISTAENAAITYDPRANDVEPNPPNYALTIASTSTPGNGAVVINSGTSLTYTPNSGYIGNDSFTYTIADGHGLTSTATDSITVGSPPTAVAAFAPTAANTAVTFNPLIGDTDPYGFVLNVISTATPAHGTVAINSGQTLTYTPTSGFTGLDTFNYTISDGHLTATAIAYVCVGYTAPVAAAATMTIKPYGYGAGAEYTPNATIDPAGAATVACGQTPTIIPVVTAVSQGTSGAVYLVSGASVQYISNVQYLDPYNGDIDSFAYTVTDPFGGTATGTVTVDLILRNLGNQ
jgi:Bacterial Ig domain/RHS Repeat